MVGFMGKAGQVRGLRSFPHLSSSNAFCKNKAERKQDAVQGHVTASGRSNGETRAQRLVTNL